METQYRWQQTKRRQDNLAEPTTVAPHNTPGCSLEVVVIHTNQRGTLAALRAAAGLAKQLSAHIRLLVPQVVPYALPLASPQVSVDFTKRHFRSLALDVTIETRVDVLVCRDKLQALESALPQ